MNTVIVLNGPPGCGKDTIARRLKSKGFSIVSMKQPMFSIALAMLGDVLFNTFMGRYDDRDLKEVHWDAIGCSPREFFIKISEDFVKPIRGRDAFGKLAVINTKDSIRRQWKDRCAGVVFPDGGFEEELDCLKADPDLDVFVVRLHRHGFNFDNDSRNYFKAADLDVKLRDGHPEEAVHQILEGVKINEYLSALGSE